MTHPLLTVNETTLGDILMEARAAGMRVDLNSDEHSDRFSIFPHWNERFIQDQDGMIGIEVRKTIVGIRFHVYEDWAAGMMLKPSWAENIAFVAESHLREWIRGLVLMIYWWSFRNLWGWQVALPWEGLDHAVEVARIEARKFELITRELT